MEELVLTDPVVVPEKVTAKYKVIALTLDWLAMTAPTLETPSEQGQVVVAVQDEHSVRSVFTYVGQEALDMMKWMNTANFSVNSMHKRVLQKLSNDGSLPGTVTGTPDPPPPLLAERED